MPSVCGTAGASLGRSAQHGPQGRPEQFGLVIRSVIGTPLFGLEAQRSHLGAEEPWAGYLEQCPVHGRLSMKLDVLTAAATAAGSSVAGLLGRQAPFPCAHRLCDPEVTPPSLGLLFLAHNSAGVPVSRTPAMAATC